MKYMLVNRKAMRPAMKLKAEDLNRLFAEEQPVTVRRPDLTEEWAKRMNAVPECDCRPLTAAGPRLD